MQAETRYAKSGDVSIAYQVHGDGPFDLVYVPGAISNVELLASDEMRRPFFEQIASYCRLILFDKRGTGASDRVAGVANLETRMDDVRAVMDAAGSERAALVGVSEGGVGSGLGDHDKVAQLVRSSSPDATDDEIRRRVSFQRLSASPGAILALQRMNAEIDVRPVLSSVRVPTLVLHRTEDEIPIDVARWTAQQIPGAQLVELPGGPHFPYLGDSAP